MEVTLGMQMYVGLLDGLLVPNARVFFANKSRTDGWILMILTNIIDIDETIKLT